MKFVGQEFVEEEIQLDFNQFTDCRFVRCTLVYGGFGDVTMFNCTSEDSDVTFSHGAANMLSFLERMYHDMGPSFHDLAEQVWDSIVHRTVDAINVDDGDGDAASD
jgi:hypothetical protein